MRGRGGLRWMSGSREIRLDLSEKGVGFVLYQREDERRGKERRQMLYHTTHEERNKLHTLSHRIAEQV